MPNVHWATHPRHLPKPPPGRVVVLDVAFAAGEQWKSKTRPFLDALGERLVLYIDHHVHKEAWPAYADDPRFVLVPNKIAHACPELVTPARVAAAGQVDAFVAHCDFDGAIAAAKWLAGGREPWPGADEDARAVDSPGRGHALSAHGARLALAMDEASAAYARDALLRFMTSVTRAAADGAFDPALDDVIDGLAAAARKAEEEATALAARCGQLEAPGVFVVRVSDKQENRTRKTLLVHAEQQAPVGCLFEPDPSGGAWLYAATFDESLDLEDVDGFSGGRSDFRFARAHKDGRDLIEALSAYVTARSAAKTSTSTPT